MTLPFSTAAALLILVVAATHAAGQQRSVETPHPQLPPMPSMEGQPGDMGKPVVAAPARPGKATVKPPAAATRGAKPKVQEPSKPGPTPRKPAR